MAPTLPFLADLRRRTMTSSSCLAAPSLSSSWKYSSSVGRLIPVSRAGLRHGMVRAAVSDAWQGAVPDDAWLLVDGESPRTTRWALALCGLFVGFATFSVIGLVKLTHKVS